MLQADTLVVESERKVFSVITSLKQGQGSFADAMIAAPGARAGCTYSLSFDRKALRLPGFRLP